jgi:hypothetical protein
MVGNMGKGMCGNSTGTLARSWSVDAMCGMGPMIAMAGTNAMCDWPLLTKVGSVTVSVSGSFLGFQKNWTVPCPMICISLMKHAVQMPILASASASPLACVAASRVLVVSSCIESFLSVF